MKKLWFIPLLILCLSASLQAQTITSFYGTTTTFVPNLYSDLQGYHAAIWTNQTMPRSTVEQYSQPMLIRGYDNINIAAIFGDDGGTTAVGTVTAYGKLGTSMGWVTIGTLSAIGTSTDYLPVGNDKWTLIRLGMTGTGTIINCDMEVYTKKR